MIQKEISLMDRDEIKSYLYEMQEHISIQLESTSIDEFLDETTIFDQFESSLPDEEYPVFVITILNGFKNENIIENIVNTIYKSTRA
tara:strand:+ start:722 stop:982 length:261 start_codon:yes stop_codon:yes gene_type:complete